MLQLSACGLGLRAVTDNGQAHNYQLSRLSEWSIDVQTKVHSRYVHGGRRPEREEEAERKRLLEAVCAHVRSLPAPLAPTACRPAGHTCSSEPAVRQRNPGWLITFEHVSTDPPVGVCACCRTSRRGVGWTCGILSCSGWTIRSSRCCTRRTYSRTVPAGCGSLSTSGTNATPHTPRTPACCELPPPGHPTPRRTRRVAVRAWAGAQHCGGAAVIA